ELSLVCSTFNRRRRGDPPVGSAATGADKTISPPQPINKITNNKNATERLVFGYRMEVSFNPEPQDNSFFADYVIQRCPLRWRSGLDRAGVRKVGGPKSSLRIWEATFRWLFKRSQQTRR